MFEALLRLLDRQRRVFLAVTAVVTLVSAGFASRLEVLDSPERWMPKSAVRAWEVFDAHFDLGDTLAMGLHFKRPVTEADQLHLHQLRKRLENVNGIRRVCDPALIAERIEAVPLTELVSPKNAERFALYQGALWDTPTDGDRGQTLLVVCEMETYGETLVTDEVNDMRRRVVQELYVLLEEESRRPHWAGTVEFHLAGGVIVMWELERRAVQVAKTFLPASILVGLVSLLWGFKSWRSVALAVGGCLVAATMVLGISSLVQIPLGVVTVATPTIMGVIALATTIHFASFYAAHPYQPGEAQRRRTIREVGLPSLGAAATTGLGFLMLSFNELGPVRDLGLQLFAGSILAFFGVFLWWQWVPPKDAKMGSILTRGRLDAWGNHVTSRPAWVCGGCILLAVVAAFLAWPRQPSSPIGIYVDADAFSFFADDQPVSKALKHFSDRKFGLYQLDVIMVPKDKGQPPVGLEPPDETFRLNAARVRQFGEAVSARKDLGILHLLSTDEFQERQREFQQSLDEVRRTEGMLPYLGQLMRTATNAAFFSETFHGWSRDLRNEGAVRLTFLTSNQGVSGFRPMVDLVESQLPTDRFDCYITGTVIESLYLAEGLTNGMVKGTLCSLALMVVLCVVLFRSLRLALIAILPNIIPNLMVFGLMGLFRIPISAGSAMVSSVALGIAFNDTIHFILHYQLLRSAHGLNRKTAARTTITDIGRPIVATSLVHVAGFAIFLLTDFLPLFHFGLLAAISMVAALLGDLLLLPNLLILLDKDSQPDAAKPDLAVMKAIAEPAPQ